MRKADAGGKTTGLFVPKEAPHDVLKQTSSLLFHQLGDHVAEHCTDRVETLVCGTDVVEPVVVQQYLLNDENSNGLGQLGACLHDSQAQRNDLGGQEKVDNLGRIVLDKGANYSKTGKAKILEGARLGGGVEKGVEVQRDMRWAKSAGSA